MPGTRGSGIDDIADSMTQDLRSVAVQSPDPFFKGERQELLRVVSEHLKAASQEHLKTGHLG